MYSGELLTLRENDKKNLPSELKNYHYKEFNRKLD